MFSQNELIRDIFSGLINEDSDASIHYQPRLVLNDIKHKKKILEFVLDNLNECFSFRFAVAFLTRSGVACLHQVLKGFFERGATGEVLISTYLNFSEPHAIKKLSEFPGINTSFVNEPNFHGKLYLFEFESFSRLLVGSSNLTQNALGRNTEINLSVSLQRTSNLYIQTVRELDYWSHKSIKVSKETLAEYAEKFNDLREEVTSPSENSDEAPVPEKNWEPLDQFVPNSMQVEALNRLSKTRENQASRSLIISATGTGKTVLSALDVKQFGAKRLLFLVHRLTIARKAKSEFYRVFGKSRKMGIYSAADQLDSEADFIFATVQTMNREEHLNKFAREEFDYIIIDETHRAGAHTYQKVIEYFKPKFLMGMTATPERTDNYDIFKLFNHSVAYEIRLQKALEANLLAPFHYFGVADVSVNGVPLNDKAEFNSLTSTARINHIIDTLKDYGTDIDYPRGLIFCSRIAEARFLCSEFNKRGFKARAITGSEPEDYREESIHLLESFAENRLEYLFTVDVFNEGVDIPSVNQVVMLRPTQSAIVFVQQLGRGLRKAPGKNYLTVIDFIGNYQNNFLIPVALFGESSYNKDKLRRLLSAGSSLIPGASSISFEKIARDRIFRSIDSSNLQTRKALVNDYNLLLYRLGRPPMMMDFIENKSRDPYQYVDYSGSLLAFSIQQESTIKVNEKNLKFLSYMSEHVCDGKRIEEAIVLKLLLENEETSVSDIMTEVYSLSGIKTDNLIIESAIYNVNLRFATKYSRSKMRSIRDLSGFKVVNFIKHEGIVARDKTLRDGILCVHTEKYLFDLCDAAISRFLNEFDIENYIDGFSRGAKYTRKDVFRILRWRKQPVALIVGGYLLCPKRKNCPIFSTYHKGAGISKTIKYEDRFINPQHFVYMSKNRRTITSPDVSDIADHESSGMRLPLFVKKSDDEGSDFYYLGELKALADRFENAMMPGKGEGEIPVVKMEFLLDRPIEHGLYKYLTTE